MKKREHMTDDEIREAQVKGTREILKLLQSMMDEGLATMPAEALRIADPFLLIASALAALESHALEILDEKKREASGENPAVSPTNKKFYN